MQELLVELRQCVRQLVKNLGFTGVAVLTLALGIGAATAIFSLVHAVLLKPLPFPHPQQLQLINTLEFPHAKQTLPASGGANIGTSYKDFFDWRARNHRFQSMAAYQRTQYLIDSGTGVTPRVANVTATSSGLFETLDVRPDLGRTFTREEEKPGNRSIVLSNELWVSDFGAARDVIGRKVHVSDQVATVIGVMPAGFRFPLVGPAEFWMTCSRDIEERLARDPDDDLRAWGDLEVVARLRPDVSPTQANAELNAIQRSLAQHFPQIVDQYAVGVVPEIEGFVSSVEKPLKLLLAAVSTLLLIACANVAGLLLARSSRRSGEMAVRAALGASRWQVMRPLMVEALLLGLSGGSLGVALAWGLLRVSLKFVPQELPRQNEVTLDWPVLGFAVGVSVLSSLVAGLLPALRMRRVTPSMAMRDGAASMTAGRGQHRLHSGLVVGQTALGLVLLVSAGLLIRSFDAVMHVDPGFDPKHLLQFGVALTDKRYSQADMAQYFKRLLPRLRLLPGVRRVTAGTPLPLSGSERPGFFRIEGQTSPNTVEPNEFVTIVEPDFFETLGVPVLRGRNFTEQDHDGHAPLVVMINQAFAKKYFPGIDPIGQHLSLNMTQQSSAMREIVGVVGDVKRIDLTTADAPEFFLPYAQALIVRPQVVMRVEGDPAAYIHAATAVVAELDPSSPMFRPRTMEDVETASIAQQRFETVLLTCFSAAALFLSAVGLYGLLAYMVVQRTKELGLRLALGSGRANLVQLIMRRGVSLASTGLCIGLVAAAGVTRLLTDLLFGVKPFDAITFVSVTLVLLTAAVLSSLLPAYRASKIDPIQTLREG